MPVLVPLPLPQKFRGDQRCIMKFNVTENSEIHPNQKVQGLLLAPLKYEERQHDENELPVGTPCRYLYPSLKDFAEVSLDQRHCCIMNFNGRTETASQDPENRKGSRHSVFCFFGRTEKKNDNTTRTISCGGRTKIVFFATSSQNGSF